MPKLNEVVQDRSTKKFVKKSYRPWDLTGETITEIVEPSISKEQTFLNEESASHLISTIQSQEKTVFVDMLDNTLGNKLDINKESFREPSDNIQVSNRNQIDNKREAYQETIGEQLDINLDPTSLQNQLLKLSGIQKNILHFVVDLSIGRHGFETGPIETATIALYTQCGTGVVKTSIKRLIDKGFISRNKGKQAKGGYINLSINEKILNAVIELRHKYNNLTNPIDLLNPFRYQLDNENAYSSSNNNLKTITTKRTEQLPEEWQQISFESLNHIGFSKTQIKQLIEKNVPELVQESINHFAYGLEHNPKFKQYAEPLNVLMGVLRKGQAWHEKDYQSPKEIAQKELLQRKKLDLEKKIQQEEEAYKLALGEWQHNLTPKEIEEIAPSRKVSGDVTPQAAKLSRYFKEQIWPDLKPNYLL